jgi:hypothetical protein
MYRSGSPLAYVFCFFILTHLFVLGFISSLPNLLGTKGYDVVDVVVLIYLLDYLLNFILTEDGVLLPYFHRFEMNVL